MRSTYRHRVLLLVCLAGCAGCATHADRLREIRRDFFSGNLEQAASSIDNRLDHPGPDADVLKLDRAMIELAAGRPQQAEVLLREVRDRFDYLDQQSAAESAGAMLTDDNTIAYAGEDYEQILIRAMLALANLMHDGGDAEAYALQVADKQQQILRRIAEREQSSGTELASKRVALGAYIGGLLREQTHSNYDDVARAYAQVVSWEPDFRTGREDLDRATHGHHSARGNGVLYVFALVGRGPYKVEVAEHPTSEAMLIADRMVSILGDQTLPPTIAPVKVPRVVLTNNPLDNVQVLVNGARAGQTETITDVGQFAVQQYQARYPRVLARAVVRRSVKKGLIYAGKELADLEKGSLLSLALDVGGVVWEATETADTRCWGLLPDKIQVLRLELPAGKHLVSLVPALGPQRVGGDHEVSVDIGDGRNTYLLANFPDGQLVGRLVTSEPR